MNYLEPISIRQQQKFLLGFKFDLCLSRMYNVINIYSQVNDHSFLLFLLGYYFSTYL